MTTPSIATVDAKINSFISSQDKHNDTVTKAIDKISNAMADLSTVHTEVNHLSEKITGCQAAIESTNKDYKSLSEKVITNSIQAEEYKHIKKLIMAFIVAGVLGGGFMMKSNNDNNATKDKIMQQQADAVLKIAKSIDAKLDDK
jgi:uncharacterized coiled-coil DUF342 family protein